jgi:putative transposase
VGALTLIHRTHDRPLSQQTSHVIYACKYHICWIPKYRYPILTGQVAPRVGELVRPLAAANEAEIITGSVSSGHVHVYVSIPPSLSVSKFVQFVRGATSHKLQLACENIRKRYCGQHVRARGYFVAASGVVSDEMIQHGVRNQHEGTAPDEDFTVLNP